MARESTPMRTTLKMSLIDVFDDITPVKEDNLKRKRKKGFFKEANRGFNNSQNENSDSEIVIKSQVYNRNKKIKSKDKQELVENDKVFTQNDNQNNSDDLMVDDENFYAGIKSQHFNSKIKYLDSETDKLLLALNCNLESEAEKILNDSDDFNSKLFKSELNGCFTTSSNDVNLSDKSVLPGNETCFSNLKKKLLENANKKEIIKSQTTGWTQYDFSDIENIKEGSFFGLPSRVQQLFEEHKGIKKLYSWQEDCLNLEAVILKKNLVYALPTSGGKSLVAEILILKEILLFKKNVLLVLPFISIVQEKIRDFSQLSLEFGFSVEEYAAGKGVVPPKKHRKRNALMIGTIEKSLTVVNSLIETNRLEELGLVVIDELHLLSEKGRGAILETLLIQILHSKKKIQIIGMTATIGNLEEIATFLKAESYSGDFRPVCLTEYIKCDDKIYLAGSAFQDSVKEIRTQNSEHEEDTSGIVPLVQEVIPSDSVLVFCPTKKNCENVAILLSRLLPRNLINCKKEEKNSLYRALTSETNEQICPILKKTLPFGVAYHHSGLTAGERKLLEEAFRVGTLSVICCTSTLAAGVNLPAKRVILRSPYVGKDFISLSKYKQMVGRAGRAGFGSEGESYLICQPIELGRVLELFRSQMDKTVSKMDSESCRSLVLSAIGLGTATSKESIHDLMRHSLFHHQLPESDKDAENMVNECVERLHRQGALAVQDSESNCQKNESGNAKEKCLKITNTCQLSISRLGRAAMKAGLDMETAHQLYEHLAKAQAGLVLLTNLHLLYLVTPYDLLNQIKPNYSVFFTVYMQLNSKEIHTAEVIGINEFVMSKLAVGIRPKNIKDVVLNRFYICLILNELWNQRTIWDVSLLFQIPRGSVQTVMTSAATFANNVLRFCEELKEFWSLKSLLTEFAPRLAHCCAPELLPLMDLPAVKRGRAKQLYDAGFKTLETLARAKPQTLVRSVDHMSYKVASQIIAAAKMLLTEKAESLKEEAEYVLEGLQ